MDALETTTKDADELALDALFETPGASKGSMLTMAERLASWSIGDFRKFKQQMAAFEAGDPSAAIFFPMMDIAAGAHSVWCDGWIAGKGLQKGCDN